MSLNRHAVRRDGNESKIIEALERVGCSVCQLDIVDLMVGRANRNYLIEVKLPGRTLNPKQEEFHKLWRGSISTVRTVDEALKAVGVMQ